MFPQIFGKYVLEREIGAGGMARVYLATLRGAGGFEKRLVVKQIRAELANDTAFVERFVEEAKIAVELSHPNIVPVYELGVEQGVYYIAMELCEGVTLAEILTHTGPFDAFEGAYVGVEICRALDYAHRRAGIVHRDVTPRNVLVDAEGAVRLIDFGIAAPANRPDSAGACEVFGSPGHMPPEQMRGAELSPATDVFAAGALLVEIWTGKAPFRRKTSAESAQALHQPRAPLSAVLPVLAPLSELVARALELEAERRPQGADELSRPLRDFLKQADSGDVARRLGERASRTQAAVAAEGNSVPAEGEGTPAPDPDATPPAALTSDDSDEAVTRTFAARDEWTAWTRQIEDETPPAPADTKAPDPGSGPSTRRLSTPSSAPRESAVPPRSGPSRGAMALLLAVVGLGALVLLFERPAPAGSGVGPPAAASQPRTAGSASQPLAPAMPSAPAPAAALPVSAASRSSAAPAKKLSASANAVPAASLDSATLRLTADPPAVVSVDGEGVHETRTTPVRGLELKPGSYRVTFRNETYGPPVATNVTLESKGSRSVHADFRAVEPSVSVR